MGVETTGRMPSIGLLILRVGVGLIMVVFGFQKLLGGPALWEGLGKAMGMFGIASGFTVWACSAAATCRTCAAR